MWNTRGSGSIFAVHFGVVFLSDIAVFLRGSSIIRAPGIFFSKPTQKGKKKPEISDDTPLWKQILVWKSSEKFRDKISRKGKSSPCVSLSQEDTAEPAIAFSVARQFCFCASRMVAKTWSVGECGESSGDCGGWRQLRPRSVGVSAERWAGQPGEHRSRGPTRNPGKDGIWKDWRVFLESGYWGRDK